MDYFTKEELEDYDRQNYFQNLPKPTRLLKRINCLEEKVIGTGSFGTVKRGFDKNNRITMAVKQIYIGES